MINFASRTNLHFEAGRSDAFAADVAAVNAYETPAGAEAQIQDLACLQYVKGELRYKLKLSAADSTFNATIHLMNGSTSLGYQVVDYTAEDVKHGRFLVDLSSVAGSSQLTVLVFANTAAAAAVTATIDAVLDVTHPAVVSV